MISAWCIYARNWRSLRFKRKVFTVNILQELPFRKRLSVLLIMEKPGVQELTVIRDVDGSPAFGPVLQTPTDGRRRKCQQWCAVVVLVLFLIKVIVFIIKSYLTIEKGESRRYVWTTCRHCSLLYGVWMSFEDDVCSEAGRSQRSTSHATWNSAVTTMSGTQEGLRWIYEMREMCIGYEFDAMFFQLDAVDYQT